MAVLASAPARKELATMPDQHFAVSSVIAKPEGDRGGGAILRWRMPHYAWIVAGVTFATLLIAGGIRGSSGILVVPLETEFHWSRGTISFAVGVNMFLYGLVGPFAAALMDSIGLRRTMLGALAAIGIGLLITPAIQQSWQLVLLWGIIVGAGTGVIANVLAATVATRWFAAQRGLVVGLLTSAAAAGQLVFLPLLAGVTVTHGWRWMALTVAAVAFGLVPLVAMLMRDRPEDIGLSPYGEIAEPGALQAKPVISNPVIAAFGILGVGLRSRDFWLLGGSLFICGASTNGLIGTHLIPACIDHGIPEVTGATLLAGMAVFNFIGATGSGWLSDRIDPRILLVAYYGLRGLSLAYLPFAFDTFYGLSMFSVFYGLDWIATIPATIRLTAGRFGTQNTGIMFGWLMVIHQTGGAMAAFMAGVLRMDLGTYLEAFILSGLLCLIAAVMVPFVASEPKMPRAVVAG
jgi:sugar phosphate permease